MTGDVVLMYGASVGTAPTWRGPSAGSQPRIGRKRTRVSAGTVAEGIDGSLQFSGPGVWVAGPHGILW